MRLEFTITDQILLTWGTGDYRSVLKRWHISERAQAEKHLADIRAQAQETIKNGSE